MAINPNTQYPNRNQLYLARSGGGKSQALGQNLPQSKARVLLYDISHDHRGVHITDKGAYVRALKGALSSGKGFRLAYDGGTSIDDFEWWCQVVWAALDGNYITHVVVEELSAVCATAAKASHHAAILLNQGRKYGMIFHGTSQKPQEISKTFYDQCEILHVGKQRGDNVRKFAKVLGLPESEIDNLKSLEFWTLDDATSEKPLRKQLQYKKVN